ncbi:pre-miRNA 5'-monophosphate methyltransferase-like isoform X1 [Asterias amurensis]|uniref:pre-miRNA 5'-monophosphate methyltransferase-like isoform X1 n=1 Tax=Asterias amurensis TaxID=7602 RepID=UPI003AB80035
MAAPMGLSTFNSGAAPFGNFINYYTFNPPEKRIDFLPKDLLQVISGESRKKSVTVLDIGCNAGDLTVAVYEHLTKPHHDAQDGDDASRDHSKLSDETALSSSTCSPVTESDLSGSSTTSDSTNVHILGCDIDDLLITRAYESNIHSENITFKTLDFMCDSARHDVLSRFLATHPDTLAGRFDLVCCFSITMWIHLQNGDEGLQKFLREVSAISNFLLIEPQPWKCYTSAVRRVSKLGVENSWRFKELLIRNTVVDEIRTYLEAACHMKLTRTLGVTHWDRKLLLFKSNGVDDK